MIGFFWKKVLVTGVFDVLHVGHIELIQRAATLGKVVVGLNDDFAVRELKGPSRPVNTQADRLHLMRAIKGVHRAFLIRATTVESAILIERPDYWVKGGDYTLETLNKTEVMAAKKVGAKIVLFKTVPGYSTTSIIGKMKL